MPPRKRTPQGPIPVDAIQHPDKRVNIPTADAQDWVGDEHLAVPQVVFERDVSLDPQLVWRGKYDGDVTEVIADAPPIYIQEKIDARVLIENLRKTAAAGGVEPEATLFDTFDGLDELDAVDFYRHAANWSNRMILGDSLQVMASLAEREALRGKVQMIYIDPPYGIKFGSNWQASARKRDVKDGKADDAAREAEQIKAFRDTWELGIHSYLSYLRDRLTVARELLTESGSVFVQIGDENVHLVRSLMDELFGSENFVSLISFSTTSGFSQASTLGRAGDYIVWYARNIDTVKTRPLFRPADARQTYTWIRFSDGTARSMTSAEKADPEFKLPDGARLYAPDNIQSQGAASTPQPFLHNGKTYHPGQSAHWKASYPDGMNRLANAGRIHVARNSIRYVRYLDDFPIQAFSNAWMDTATGNFTDDKVYVVQTGSKAIERCLLLCTDPGDLVLDPTCGSGTTAAVAEQWGRRWITIDTSRVALALARQRLMGGRYPYYLLADSQAGRLKEQEVTGKPMPPAQVNDDIRHGFVYERVQHVTLKSIANNPDIVQGMSRAEIDAAIKRHADFEYLYDKPCEDKNRVRVSGPFTVESLSPHRVLSPDVAEESGTETAATLQPDAATFEQSILDNLAKAGIQNGAKAERIEFAAVDRHPGVYVQAIGERRASEGGTPGRVAIAVGPQYGTVDSAFIKQAAKEALAAKDVGLLCVLGFAFDPQAMGATPDDAATLETEGGFTHVAVRSVGRIQVLYVRMNVDLLMGTELKKTGAGNLFTVFGEPDIETHTHPDGTYSVTLHGVDVYDPTTGEIRPSGTDNIALWMIDTDYDGESFFVRHCYFTGGNDPLKKLKTALKAEIDADAWASLYKTTSRPFDKPTSGRIAVKVINDYGDEVMKVFEVA